MTYHVLNYNDDSAHNVGDAIVTGPSAERNPQESTKDHSLRHNPASCQPMDPTVDEVRKHRDPLHEDSPMQPNRPVVFAWGWELCGLFLSMASLIAAAVVLSLYNGRPLQEWTFSASLNTIISILGVISKTTLAFAVSSAFGQHKWNWFRARKDELDVFVRFDEASRGPWGSLRLLHWSKARNWASIGAVVVIFTLLIDPFLQATVSLAGVDGVPDYSGYVSRYDPDNGAWVPAARKVDIGLVYDFFTNSDVNTTLDRDGFLLSDTTVVPDFGMVSALYDGFYQPRASTASTAVETISKQTVRFGCSTGNCTYPIFTTAAVCSRCNDVPRSSIIRTTGVSTSYQVGSDQFRPKTVSRATNASYTGYNVAYGHIRQFDDTFNDFYTDVLLTAFVNTNYSQSATFKDDNTTFATFLIMRASRDFLNESVSWEDSWPTVTECGLSFCAKAYLSNAVSGILNETELGSWSVRGERSWSAVDVYQSEDWKADPDRLPLWDQYHPTFDMTGDRLDRSDLQVRLPSQGLRVTLPNMTVIDLSMAIPSHDGRLARFNFTQTTVLGLQEAINDVFIGQNPTRTASGEMMNRTFVVYPIRDPSASKPIADLLWNATDNFTTMFDNVAQRLTLQIRDTSRDSTGSERMAGTAVKYELHIHVQWGYFSVLVITVILGFVYVLGVLLQTHQLGLPAWKETAALAFAPDEARAPRLLRKITFGSNLGHDRPGPPLVVGLRETSNGYRLQSR